MKIRLPWMSRADRRRWQTAGSLADLGELTALWLEGGIASQIDYEPKCGPDEETLPLIPTLAASNRGGYLTTCSQPGSDAEVGSDHLAWQQRAAVEGYVRDPELFGRLVSAADAAGIDVLITESWAYFERGAVVSRAGEWPVTWFGSYLSYWEIQDAWSEVGEDARNDILGATRLTLAAPEYGVAAGAVLWDFLDGFFSTSRAAAAS